MFISFWRAARWFLLAGGIFVAGIVCALFIKYPFDKIGDLATWVGAIGTIAAFVGTIWLASREIRERQSDKIVLALIAADIALHHVYAALSALQRVETRLDHPEWGEGVLGKKLFIECATDLRGLRVWTKDDLIALSVLPNKCASKIARSNGDIARIINLLDPKSEIDPTYEDAWRNSVARNSAQMARDCAKMLGSVVNTLHKELGVHHGQYL